MTTRLQNFTSRDTTARYDGIHVEGTTSRLVSDGRPMVVDHPLVYENVRTDHNSEHTDDNNNNKSDVASSTLSFSPEDVDEGVLVDLPNEETGQGDALLEEDANSVRRLDHDDGDDDGPSDVATSETIPQILVEDLIHQVERFINEVEKQHENNREGIAVEQETECDVATTIAKQADAFVGAPRDVQMPVANNSDCKSVGRGARVYLAFLAAIIILLICRSQKLLSVRPILTISLGDLSLFELKNVMDGPNFPNEAPSRRAESAARVLLPNPDFTRDTTSQGVDSASAQTEDEEEELLLNPDFPSDVPSQGVDSVSAQAEEEDVFLLELADWEGNSSLSSDAVEVTVSSPNEPSSPNKGIGASDSFDTASEPVVVASLTSILVPSEPIPSDMVRVPSVPLWTRWSRGTNIHAPCHRNNRDTSTSFLTWIMNKCRSMLLVAEVISILFFSCGACSMIQKRPVVKLIMQNAKAAAPGGNNKLDDFRCQQDCDLSRSKHDEAEVPTKLASYEHMVQFLLTFEPCGKGRKTGSEQTTDQGDSSPNDKYFKLTVPELQRILVVLTGEHLETGKPTLVHNVYNSYAKVLETFSESQILSLLEAKKIVWKRHKFSKKDLIETALEAGFC